VKWHRCLPQSVRNHYDVEDMVSDVIMHVLAQSPKHDSTRGKESTFVWWTADNKCKAILRFWQKQMRAGALVEIEDEYGAVYKRGSCETVALTDLVARTLPHVDTSPDYLRALDAVERVIEYASDAVLDVLEELLSGRLRRTVSDDLIAELQTLTARHNASMVDFMRVLQVV
jgi:DNA-directed RNA polymerase specialized sigma24 family protein